MGTCRNTEGRLPWRMIVVCTALAGCAKPDASDSRPLDNPPEVCIDVRPRELLYKDRSPTSVEPVEIQIATISNGCEGTLVLSRVEMDPAHTPFGFGPLDGVWLESGESMDLPVWFEPIAVGPFEARIIIDTNATDGAPAQVALRGDAVGGNLTITSADLDFGSPLIGCTERRPVELINTGLTDLEVHTIELRTDSTTEISIDLDSSTNGALPFIIAPYVAANEGPKVMMFADYSPLDTLTDEAEVIVHTDDPNSPTTLSFTAGGTLFADIVDTFVQPPAATPDVLFTLDRSPSMSKRTDRLIAGFASFQKVMSDYDVDFHVALTVADDGCVVGPRVYIDRYTSSSKATEALRSMSDQHKLLAPDLDNTRRGFMLAEAAFAQSTPPRDLCNPGFIRPDSSSISLISVSDSPEQSVNPWLYYANLFRSLKDDPDTVTVSAIAGDYPSGCGDAAEGTGYHEAAAFTGGLFLSICEPDWSEHMASIALASLRGYASHNLSLQPVAKTIGVRVDGKDQTTGWSYDEHRNAIVFDKAYVPRVGARIDVMYHKQPECGG